MQCSQVMQTFLYGSRNTMSSVKFWCSRCFLCFISPRTLVNVARRLTNLKSIWDNKPLASIALSPFWSSDISFSRRKMAGSLPLTVLQALYLHAHGVSISLCNSLGGPWNISLCTSSHLWCTYDPDTIVYHAQGMLHFFDFSFFFWPWDCVWLAVP